MLRPARSDRGHIHAPFGRADVGRPARRRLRPATRVAPRVPGCRSLAQLAQLSTPTATAIACRPEYLAVGRIGLQTLPPVLPNQCRSQIGLRGQNPRVGQRVGHQSGRGIWPRARPSRPKIAASQSAGRRLQASQHDRFALCGQHKGSFCGLGICDQNVNFAFANQPLQLSTQSHGKSKLVWVDLWQINPEVNVATTKIIAHARAKQLDAGIRSSNLGADAADGLFVMFGQAHALHFRFETAEFQAASAPNARSRISSTPPNPEILA